MYRFILRPYIWRESERERERERERGRQRDRERDRDRDRETETKKDNNMKKSLKFKEQEGHMEAIGGRKQKNTLMEQIYL